MLPVVCWILARLEARQVRARWGASQWEVDRVWKARYQVWFEEHGWLQGAPTPAQAYGQIVRDRLTHH